MIPLHKLQARFVLTLTFILIMIPIESRRFASKKILEIEKVKIILSLYGCQVIRLPDNTSLSLISTSHTTSE